MGFGIAHAYGHVTVHGFGWREALAVAGVLAAFIQAGAAIAIVRLTTKLAVLTEGYAKAADESAKAANESVSLAREALGRDGIQAKRAKQSFLRAIGMELDALRDQLDASAIEVKSAEARVRDNGQLPQFTYSLRTGVYTTQIGKLRDVDDCLVLAVIHFYSDFGIVGQMFQSVNDLGAEYNRAEGFLGQKSHIRTLVISTLTELLNQFAGFGKRLRELRAKLPTAETDK
jgi:hypothetical protein